MVTRCLLVCNAKDFVDELRTFMLQASSFVVDPLSTLSDLWLQDWGRGRTFKGGDGALKGRQVRECGP